MPYELSKLLTCFFVLRILGRICTANCTIFFVYSYKVPFMKVALLSILLLFGFVYELSAQYNTPQNMVWTFGDSTGLDFSSGVPVSMMSSFSNLEGGATVSDTRGNLLFYSNGRTIYNRTHAPMPSASSIVSFETNSTTQSCLIVPFVDDTNKYYVFSLEWNTFARPSCRLAYSEVDMTLDGGLGDVLPGRVGMPLESAMGEKLIAIPGNDCNVWVIAHKMDTTLFYVYEVTSAGVSTPAVYDVGSIRGTASDPIYPGFGPYAFGVMKCSHDRSNIFVATSRYASPFIGGGELFDFDANTGTISNCRVIASTEGMYGAEFSPDNTKLYTCSADSQCILQYDLSAPSLSAIVASRTVVSGVLVVYSDIKLGPDGKLYVNDLSSHYLDCIPNPNNAGVSCGYLRHFIDLSPRVCRYSFPNTVWSTSVRPFISGPDELCAGDIATFTSSASGNSWESSNVSVASVGSSSGIVFGVAAGTAIITCFSSSGCFTTSEITVHATSGDIFGPGFICKGDTTYLSSGMSGGYWLSSDTAIATVGYSGGGVRGKAAGLCTITYFSEGGICHSELEIEVRDCALHVVGPPGESKSVNIYPVPSDAILWVDVNRDFTDGKLSIYDNLGRKLIVAELDRNHSSVSLAALIPGSYLCVVSDSTGGTVHRQLILKQ